MSMNKRAFDGHALAVLQIVFCLYVCTHLCTYCLTELILFPACLIQIDGISIRIQDVHTYLGSKNTPTLLLLPPTIA